MTLVKEWQEAIAKIPSDWTAVLACSGLFCANSPDGEDRMCVDWAWHTEDNPPKPVHVMTLVRSPSNNQSGRDHEFYKVDIWEDDGRLIGSSGRWRAWLSGDEWRWSVLADADGNPEVSGSCATRFDAIGESYKVRWDRTMEHIKARAKAMHSTN